jgi:hypothetical protein
MASTAQGIRPVLYKIHVQATLLILLSLDLHPVAFSPAGDLLLNGALVRKQH